MFSRRTMLKHHLEYNHYPPVRLTEDQLDEVEAAIDRVADGAGIVRDEQIVEAFHLDDPAFMGPGDDEFEAEELKSNPMFNGGRNDT